MAAGAISLGQHAAWRAAVVQACLLPVQLLHGLVARPEFLFIVTLGAMLFHPPDVQVHGIDRVAFVLLVVVVLLRVFALKLPLQAVRGVTWPMLALVALAAFRTLSQPYDAQNLSVYAARWLVPFALLHVSGYVFADEGARHRLELFLLIVLAYLALMAVFFMIGAREWIFPRYILDESLGIHADRARGPFLQAVANGMAINLLGLLALDSFRRRVLRGTPAMVLLALLPLAIVATKTRAVWLSFAGSIVCIVAFSQSRRLRRACLAMVLAGAAAGIALVACPDVRCSLMERLEDRSPVEFRAAVYNAGWQMFLEKPFSGWGPRAMQDELSLRVSDFHQEAFYVHNTYLEILIEHGLLGLGLYLSVTAGLFRLRGKRIRGNMTYSDYGFACMWPVFLAAYVVNANFVGMNYQFVNGLVFSMAGILAAQNGGEGVDGVAR
jgi:O-antigen ligase